MPGLCGVAGAEQPRKWAAGQGQHLPRRVRGAHGTEEDLQEVRWQGKATVSLCPRTIMSQQLQQESLTGLASVEVVTPCIPSWGRKCCPIPDQELKKQGDPSGLQAGGGGQRSSDDHCPPRPHHLSLCAPRACLVQSSSGPLSQRETVSRAIACSGSGEWGASVHLGCVWTWLPPLNGVASKHPRGCKCVIVLSASLTAHCPGQVTPETTLRDQGWRPLSWTGPQSLAPYFQLSLTSSPQPDHVCTKPTPLHPIGLQGPVGASLPAQPRIPHLWRPWVLRKNPTPYLCLPSLPLGAPFLSLLPY